MAGHAITWARNNQIADCMAIPALSASAPLVEAVPWPLAMSDAHVTSGHCVEVDARVIGKRKGKAPGVLSVILNRSCRGRGEMRGR